jgi:hypothetical protein
MVDEDDVRKSADGKGGQGRRDELFVDDLCDLFKLLVPAQPG